MKKEWKDDTGIVIPDNRITAFEKLKEKAADNLLKEALKASDLLATFKTKFKEQCEKIYLAALADAGAQGRDKKGNFTWYNFDKTIKVEVNIQDRIDFDDALIIAAREKFNAFLEGAANGVEEMVKSLIMDAFSTAKGKLDTKKVLGLLRYRVRVDEKKFPLFHEALDCVERSITRPDSKTYYRISVKNGQGEYESVKLNFSEI